MPADAVGLLDYVHAGASIVTFHIEAAVHPHRLIHAIQKDGAKAGLAVNPGTPLEAIYPLLDDVDVIMLMSVNPGFGGQSFIAHALDKLREARRRIDAAVQASGREIMLEVDGGVKADNIGAIARAGADTFVAGSAIFGARDYKATIAAMRSAIQSG